MVHHWKETGKVRGPSRRLENSLRKAIELSGIKRDNFWPSEGKHEVGVRIGVAGIRSAEATAEAATGCITGTDDFQWYILEDELWIDDLKTGKYYAAEDGSNRYPQDVRSAQLRFYALAVATLLGYRGTVHVSLTHWPRLPLEFRHAEPVRTWTTYTTDELNEYWTELEALYREIQAGHEGDYTLNPGDHCRFCPSRNYCIEAEQFEQHNWRHDVARNGRNT